MAAGARTEAGSEVEAPQPQPELTEERLHDPGLRDLSRRDYVAIASSAPGERPSMTSLATFAGAIRVLARFWRFRRCFLLSLGLFSVLAGPEAVDTVLSDRSRTVVPSEAVTLIEDSLTRVTESQAGGIADDRGRRRYRDLDSNGRDDDRDDGARPGCTSARRRAAFSGERLTALAPCSCWRWWRSACRSDCSCWARSSPAGSARLSGWRASSVGSVGPHNGPFSSPGCSSPSRAFCYLGPNVDHPKFSFITPGAVVAVLILARRLGPLRRVRGHVRVPYDKAWARSPASSSCFVWLWLSSAALLLGAETNAEAERSRELRRGEPAQHEIQAPAKA